MRAAVALLLILALAGCEDESTRLTVDLITDLVPSLDYVGTTVTVAGADQPPQTELAWAEQGDGYRIASFSGLAEGPAEIMIDVVTAAGEIAYRRSVLVDVVGSTGVTIVVTRSCQGVICDTGEACVGGRCLDNHCSLTSTEGCSVGCEDDSDCEQAGSCELSCRAGECLADLQASCEVDQWCHPNEGCVARLADTEATITVEVEGLGRARSQFGNCEANSTCELTVPIDTQLELEAESAGEELFRWVLDGVSGCETRDTCEFRVSWDAHVRAEFGEFTHTVTTIEPLDEDGTALETRLSGLAFSSDGTLYAAAVDENLIYAVMDGGTLVRVAGSVAGFTPGTVSALDAQFADPQGIDFDGEGNLYIADEANNRIRVLTPDGMVSTYAGSGREDDNDGSLLEASFAGPVRLQWRESIQTLMVHDRNGIRLIRNDQVETVAAPHYGTSSPAGMFSDGTLAWSHIDGVHTQSPGANAMLRYESPCHRRPSQRYELIVTPDDQIIEGGSAFSAFCRIDSSGRSQPLLLRGVGQRRDGPNYLATVHLVDGPIAASVTGEIAVVGTDDQILRLLIPN